MNFFCIISRIFTNYIGKIKGSIEAFMPFVFLVFFFISGEKLYAQQKTQMDVLLDNAREIIYSDPEQAAKSAQIILENSENPVEKAQAYLVISKIYVINGKYDKALEAVYKAENIAEKIKNNDISLQALSLAEEILDILNLSSLSKSYRTKIVKIREGFSSKETPLKSTDITTGEDFGHAKLTKGLLSTRQGQKLLEENKPDFAKTYFETAEKNITERKKSDYWEMINQLYYSEYYFQKKAFQKAIDLLENARQKNEKFKNAYFGIYIYYNLSKNYLAISSKEKFRENYLNVQVCNVQISRELTAGRDFALKNITNEKNNAISRIQSENNTFRNILIFIALFLLVSGIYIRYINYSKVKHKKELIAYLNLTKKENIKEETLQKQVIASDDTEKNLLSKLEKFENSEKFLNEDMSLPLLASQLSTNTKYLSSIVNKHKGKNFSTYINELRINYIIKKLKTNPVYQNYKISYLAEECGFASHNSFTFAFKKQIGMSPMTFIEFLKQEKNHENISV